MGGIAEVYFNVEKTSEILVTSSMSEMRRKHQESLSYQNE